MLRLMDEGSRLVLNTMFGAVDSANLLFEIMLYTGQNTAGGTNPNDPVVLENPGGGITGTLPADAYNFLDFNQARYAADNFGSGIYVTQKVLPAPTFTDVEVGAGVIPEVSWGPITFTFSGPLDATFPTVRGFLIVNTANVHTAWQDFVLYAENLSDSRTPSASGDTLIITPKFRLGNGTPV